MSRRRKAIEKRFGSQAYREGVRNWRDFIRYQEKCEAEQKRTEGATKPMNLIISAFDGRTHKSEPIPASRWLKYEYI